MPWTSDSLPLLLSAALFLSFFLVCVRFGTRPPASSSRHELLQTLLASRGGWVRVEPLRGRGGWNPRTWERRGDKRGMDRLERELRAATAWASEAHDLQVTVTGERNFVSRQWQAKMQQQQAKKVASDAAEGCECSRGMSEGSKGGGQRGKETAYERQREKIERDLGGALGKELRRRDGEGGCDCAREALRGVMGVLQGKVDMMASKGHGGAGRPKPKSGVVSASPGK